MSRLSKFDSSDMHRAYFDGAQVLFVTKRSFLLRLTLRQVLASMAGVLRSLFQTEGSMKIMVVIALALSISLLQTMPASGDDFKKREAQIAEYKRWLDSLGPNGSRFWIRLDGQHRPHRLYLGEGFYRADFQSQERFVDTFSHYLAGHPEKFMLIDLFDAATNKPVGEFGWGGFKLYSQPGRSPVKVQ